MWDPQAIADLQVASRTNNEDAYWRFAEHVNERPPATPCCAGC
jgi:glutamate synthase (NADPH) large chain